MQSFRYSVPIVLLLLLAPALVAEEIRGRVELVGADGQALPEGRDSIVYFELAGASSAAELPTDGLHEVVTADKDFKPRVLAVPLGSTVAFPNEDPILHNVFSVSGENRFDLGLYRGGDSREVTFENPGVVRIFCNVHHSMAASILVLETPYFTQPDVQGQFVLELPDAAAGAAPRTGKLTVWHQRAEPWSREISLPLDGPLQVQLEAIRERVVPHRNKFGKPYRTRRGRDY